MTRGTSLASICSWRHGTAAHVLTAIALAGLVLLHALYWFLTHAVNKFWVADQKLGKAGTAFFNPSGERVGQDWTRLRNRWEYSHVARACCAMVARVALAAATAL